MSELSTISMRQLKLMHRDAIDKLELLQEQLEPLFRDWEEAKASFAILDDEMTKRYGPPDGDTAQTEE